MTAKRRLVPTWALKAVLIACLIGVLVCLAGGIRAHVRSNQPEPFPARFEAHHGHGSIIPAPAHAVMNRGVQQIDGV